MSAHWNFVLFSLFSFINVSHGLNLGLISGDLKRSSSPFSIKKITHHSPVFINVHPKSIFDKPSITLPKLPSKPPPSLEDLFSSKLPLVKPKLDLLKPKLPKLRSSPLLKSPLLPKLPLLPLIPPIFPLVPRLPLLPSPIPKLPLLPLIPSLRPLKLPSLGKKSLLQKALGSELKPTLLPSLDQKRKENILEMLLELKSKGSLTTVEFIKLKKLLLK